MGFVSRPRFLAKVLSIVDSQQKNQVGVLREHPPISPLSLGERVRRAAFR
jgi:hypothetical protein